MLHSSFALALIAISKLADGAYAQQPLFGFSVPEPEEDPKQILLKNILLELDAGQFCKNATTTFALWSKGRALTFYDGALWARQDADPAEFVFARSQRDPRTMTISHIDPFGRQFWLQDNYGRQYINRDSNNVEFSVRLRKDDKKGYVSIARSDRCLRFNDQGEGQMTSNTACDLLEFKAVAPWNETWNDPLTWKNCVEDHIKLEKDTQGVNAAEVSDQAVENLRWAICRIRCARDHAGSHCKECEAVGYY